MNEFTIAFYNKKPIGVLKGSSGITDIVEKIAKICDKVGEKDRIVYEKEPKRLVRNLAELNQ